MSYLLLKLLHLVAVVLWVGGMAFAMLFLRPALPVLEPPQRLLLMQRVLQRFLNAAGIAVLLVLASGFAMFALGARGAHVHAMAVLGLAMAVIYAHVRFAVYPRLARAVAASDGPAGAAALAGVRRWVGVNLVLGVVVIAQAVLQWP